MTHPFAKAYTEALSSGKLVLMPSPDIPADAPEHAPLGCSSADRWMVCAGAPQMEAHFENTTSPAAAEGTAAHEVRERCLVTGQDVEQLVGEVIEADGFKFPVTQEWARLLQPGIDLVREQKGLLFVEYRVDLGAWIPGEFGTSDTIVITEDEVWVIDLKFGRGVHVVASETRQLKMYGMGVWENIVRHIPGAPTRYRLIVDQPRIPGGYTELVIELDELLLFAETAAAAAVATQDPDAPLVVSPSGCRFCLAAANAACPALHAFCADLLNLDPETTDMNEVPDVPDIDTLTPERRSYVIQHTPMLKKWLESIHGLQLHCALQGMPTPGYKAVATQGDRAWADPEAAAEFWKGKMPVRDIYTQKLKSPAQMEKVAGTRNWAKAQELITRPEGKPALVPLADKREALIPAINLLDELDDQDDLIVAETNEVDELDELI